MRRPGCRVPDLDLRGTRVATIFGLLPAAKFVLLNLAPAAPAQADYAPASYSGRLDVRDRGARGRSSRMRRPPAPS